MDTLQCGIVLANLEVFDCHLDKRRAAAALYNQLLSDAKTRLPDGTLMMTVKVSSGIASSYGQYTLIIEHRDAVSRYMKEKGIPTAIHYPMPVNEQAAYRASCCPDCTPVASFVAAKVLSLPMHPFLVPSQQHEIVEQLVLGIEWANQDK